MSSQLHPFCEPKDRHFVISPVTGSSDLLELNKIQDMVIWSV